MALIPYDAPLLRQPAGLVRINEKHWLARDLVFAHSGLQAFVFNRPVEDIQAGISAVLPGGTQHPGLPNTVGWVPNASSANDWTLPVDGLALPITLACWFYSVDSSTNDSALSVRRALGSEGGVTIRRSSAETVQALSNTTGGVTSAATNSASYRSGQWLHAAAAFVALADRRIQCDGASVTTNTSARTFPTSCNVVSVGRYCNAADTVATTAISGIAMPLVVGRLLTEDEGARLHDEQRSNPWDLFTERPIWVPVSSGGGYTHPTLSNARMGSLTTTGGVPLVDYTF